MMNVSSNKNFDSICCNFDYKIYIRWINREWYDLSFKWYWVSIGYWNIKEYYIL